MESAKQIWSKNFNLQPDSHLLCHGQCLHHRLTKKSVHQESGNSLGTHSNAAGIVGDPAVQQPTFLTHNNINFPELKKHKEL